MNLELFIAKRIHFEKRGEKNVPRPIVRIVMNGIAVSIMVMLISTVSPGYTYFGIFVVAPFI